MENKKITIDIVGIKSSEVFEQAKILDSISQVSLKPHPVNSIVSYFDRAVIDADVVIVNLSDRALEELTYIEKANSHNKSIIVIGDKSNIHLLATAISAGVKEFIDVKEYPQLLLRITNKILLNRSFGARQKIKHKLSVVINAKGGSGASLIACNIAYLLAKTKALKVALLDLDLQFGTIGLNFDAVPKYSIVHALNEINDLDHVSLEGYMVKYNDYLNLLLPSADEIILPGEIEPKALKVLLSLLQRSYNHVIIDLPRIIDPLSSAIMEQADNITIVVQQTLAQYRDSRRLIQILNKDLDIPLEKIVVVINRYDPKNSLKRSDMVNVINHDNVFTIANDFELAAATSNLGEPLSHKSPNSKIANDLKKLAMFLGELEEDKKAGILDKFKAILA